MSGVHNPAVDVPEFLQRKEIRGVFGAVENKGCRPMKRNGAGIRGRIRFLPPVETECFYVHERV